MLSHVHNPLSGLSRKQLLVSLVLLALLLVAVIHDAHAMQAGGGLPTDDWLAKIRASVTGPYAWTASVLGLVGAGSLLIFGGADMNGFLRTLLFIVMVLAFLAFAENFIRSVTGQGAEVRTAGHAKHQQVARGH
jgi:type IV secretory pathway VirB2 component (pilin)